MQKIGVGLPSVIAGLAILLRITADGPLKIDMRRRSAAGLSRRTSSALVPTLCTDY